MESRDARSLLSFVKDSLCSHCVFNRAMFVRYTSVASGVGVGSVLNVIHDGVEYP